MTDVLDEVASGRYEWPRQARRRRVRRVTFLSIAIPACVVALIVALVATGAWWFRGGTFLRAAGAGFGNRGTVGELHSFGIDLETDSGPRVVLDHVSADVPDGLDVHWSVYRNGPDEMGFGSATGPLRPRWPTVPVDGFQVAQPAGHPDRGGTTLVATARATRPGVYHLSNIDVTYRSGPRTRHVAGNTDVCLLAVAPGDATRVFHEVDTYEPGTADSSSVDPLVAEYEQCSDPSPFG